MSDKGIAINVERLSFAVEEHIRLRLATRVNHALDAVELRLYDFTTHVSTWG